MTPADLAAVDRIVASAPDAVDPGVLAQIAVLLKADRGAA